MQQQNYRKSAFTAVLGSGLVATIIGLTTSTAFAQQTTTSPLTVRSTGTISGTLELPFFNPNYNRVQTIVDTDENGAYYRNIGTKKNPQLVKVYQSPYVVQVRKDGSLRPFVRFKGIPVTSFDAIIESPVLSDGEMTTFRYDGRPDMEGTVIKGVVQDEFGVKRAFYTGTLTDPDTGTQYQGTFELSGQGPRYSDRNGGDSPTVFDFKSDLPGRSSTVKSFKIQDNSPLVKLQIKVPEGTSIVTPTTGGGTPPTTGGSTPPTTGGSTPPSTGGGTPPTTGGSTPPTTGGGTPPTTGGSTPPTTGGGTPPTTGGGIPPSIPSTNLAPSSSPVTTSSPSTNLAPSSSPVTTSSPSTNLNPSSSPTTSTPSSPSTPSTPSTPSPDITNIEFSSGKSFVSNSVAKNPSKFGKVACSQDSVCDKKASVPKQRGPRSRVMMR